MQTPYVFPSDNSSRRNRVFSGGQLSIIRFVASIAMVLITLIIVIAQNGSSRSGAGSAVSPTNFSSGMPLP